MTTHRRTTFRYRCLTILSAIFGIILAYGCGSSGGGGGTETTYGDTLNSSYVVSDVTCSGTWTSGTVTTGTFSVAVNGTMSTCVNATTPTAEVQTTVPTGMDIASTETNITSGAASYKLTLGNDPYNTDTDASVTVAVPFTVGTIPALKQTSTYIFLRILNLSDGSLVDVIGDVNTTTGVVTAGLMGLPPSMSVSVIYNSNMVAQSSTGTAVTASISATKSLSRTWGAAKYCVLYDPTDPLVVSALATYQTTNPGKTVAQMVDTTIAANAVTAQDAYVAAGFRQAALVIKAAAKYPCGDILGTTPRFFIHYAHAGSSFNPTALPFFGTYIPAVLDNNYYGSLYISPNRTNLATTDTLGPVGASVAHEMFHSVQFGYDLITWDKTSQGYIEGTASTYGRSIGMSSSTTTVPPVSRPGSSQIFMLSNYVTQNAADEVTRVDNIAYTNQDFFAFVGRKYGSNSLSYLNTLFDQMNSDITTASGLIPAAYYQPPRSLLFGSMDTTFKAKLTGGKSLQEVYIDFLRQRAMEHDADSQLHSGEPTTSGTFASDLFETQTTNGGKGLVEVSIDPLALVGQTIKFSSVAPLAARAIRITPSQVISTTGTGATITVAVSLLGSSFSGAAYQNGVYQVLSTSNTFSGFGMAATNEIVILVANVQTSSDTTSDVTVTISGTNGSGGGGGGYISTFTLTDFSLPGEGSWTPSYVYIMPDIAGISVIDGIIFSDATQSYALKNLQVQFGMASITGAGTYTITGDNPFTGPAAVLYSPGTTAAAAKTGKVFTSSGGTITITTWGTAMGDHITGTVAATMKTDDTPPVTGTLGATFDFVLGSFNPL